jgi:hypothetical protein
MAKKKYPPASKKDDSSYPPWDKQFSVSLAKPDNPKVYQQFYETDKLEDAKKTATTKANVEGRECIVFDRHLNWIVFTYKPEKKDSKDAQSPSVQVPPQPKPKYRPAKSRAD